ncbi:MAG: exosortase/archaeosortase family protein [Desulfurococcales archaeon]|nr:exosortase/archaeosortase family protein [Desulfurococcales archaeon]
MRRGTGSRGYGRLGIQGVTGSSYSYTSVLSFIGLATLVVSAVFLLEAVLVEVLVSVLRALFEATGYGAIESSWNSIIVYKPELNVITLIITKQCLGVYAPIAYSLFVLLTPLSTRREKAVEILKGSLVLYSFNIARIYTAGLVGVNMGYKMLRFYHDIIGAIITILLVVVMWVLWLRRIGYRVNSDASP